MKMKDVRCRKCKRAFARIPARKPLRDYPHKICHMCEVQEEKILGCKKGTQHVTKPHAGRNMIGSVTIIRSTGRQVHRKPITQDNKG